jgi:hypothetical protein
MRPLRFDLAGGGSVTLHAPLLDGVVHHPLDRTREIPFPMRIDTGADISVIPRKVFRHLQLQPDGDQKFPHCGPDRETQLLSIYRVDIELVGDDPQVMHGVQVVVLPVPYVLIGLWTCLEYCDLRCDFLKPLLRIEWGVDR